MSLSYFPLRWESTGDQWWYASPIDWAAANGHYELVRELLRLDTNLLIKLTSLRRIRRLETVWDDDARFVDAAKCRSAVARNLLHECETKEDANSLIRAGYGGWLLYTAASAGDMGFVKDLLERDPLLVFGEGEYGVTDILYAAARGKSNEVFRVIFSGAVSPRCLMDGQEEIEGRSKGGSGGGGGVVVFKWEIVKRAVHAAARGGNLEMLKEIVGDCCIDVLACRDSQGSTILHAASGRGQVQVVNNLISSFNIIESRDNQGNTSLHIASYRGYLPVVVALISASPSLTRLKNNAGDTFFHLAIEGFRTPGFRRLDRQMELMTQLISGDILNVHEIINIQNNEGRTALHVAVVGNIHSSLVEVLITIPNIKLNIQDIHGMTPLDLLSQHPNSASSEMLIKRLISAGGISLSSLLKVKTAIAFNSKLHSGVGNSPGTSFKISDAEIFLYSGIEPSDASGRPSSSSSIGRSEPPRRSVTIEESQGYVDKKKTSSSVNSAARRLRILLRWRHREKKTDNESANLMKKWDDREETPTPLRQRFSKGTSSLVNNKRTLAVRSSVPSPAAKKKFAAGLMHGVIQAMPHLVAPQPRMPVSPLSSSAISSPTLEKQKGVCIDGEMAESSLRISSFKNANLMNQYFCFGAQGSAADGQANNHRHGRLFKGCVSPVS